MAALLGGSHPVFDLGECLLDGIEIGRVWRQEPEAGAGGADRIAYDAGLMAAEIVHDDDISRLEAGDQLLANLGQEAFAVDRTIEDARRGEPIAAQGAQEGHGAPVAVRGEAAPPLTSRHPAAA